MLTRSSAKVTISVDNTRVVVAGRAYSRPHVILVGPAEMRLVLEASSGVRLEASFSETPNVETVDRDVIKVVAREKEFRVGTPTQAEAVREFEGYIELEGDKLMFKFEVDETGAVTVIAPNLGRIKGEAAEIGVKGPHVTVNMITLPFITGMLYVSGRAKAKVYMREGRIFVEIGKP